jgi:hypothetical protein
MRLLSIARRQAVTIVFVAIIGSPGLLHGMEGHVCPDRPVVITGQLNICCGGVWLIATLDQQPQRYRVPPAFLKDFDRVIAANQVGKPQRARVECDSATHRIVSRIVLLSDNGAELRSYP